MKALVFSNLEITAEQVIQKRRLRFLDFALSEWQQADDLHASRERVREFRHEQYVGRTGQEEAPGRTIAIDRRLERREDSRDPLNFVEDRPVRQVPDKPHGIFLGGREKNKLR